MKKCQNGECPNKGTIKTMALMQDERGKIISFRRVKLCTKCASEI